jgi:hypothetical protein
MSNIPNPILSKVVLNGNTYDLYDHYDSSLCYGRRELSDYTWQDLSDMCTTGDFAYIRVGDYKTLTVGSEKVQMQIAGIDTYYNFNYKDDSNNTIYVGHHIDWISKDCLSTLYQWKDLTDGTVNNNGTSTENSPYLSSYIKQQLNSDSFLKKICANNAMSNSFFTNKKIYVDVRYSDTGLIENSTRWKIADLGKFWLPTEFEVFGAVTWGTKGYSAGCAVQYPLFTNNINNKLKRQGTDGNYVDWWTCTPYGGGTGNCVAVGADGRCASLELQSGTDPAKRGVPVCFRIGG